MDDLTNLRKVKGTFDFLVDYGTLDDLGHTDRDMYVRNVLPLTRAGSRCLVWCFEWPARWWEESLPFQQAFEPAEAEGRFGEHFEIERIAGTETPQMWKRQRALVAYLMTRRSVQP